jgi:hypothetical protein
MGRLLLPQSFGTAAENNPGTGAVLADPSHEMLREPRLLVPGMQPLGAVRVDWTHPSTKALAAYYIANPAGLYDAVARKLTLFPAYQRRTGKELFITPTQTSELTIRAFGATSNWGNDTSVLQVNRIAATSYLAASYITNLGYWYYDSAHYVKVSDKFLSVPATYAPVICACTAMKYVAYGSSPGWLYVNGQFVARTTTSAGSNGSTTFYMNDDSSLNCGGSVMALWKRTLPEPEAASLSADPYQFLIPA